MRLGEKKNLKGTLEASSCYMVYNEEQIEERAKAWYYEAMWPE